MDMQNVKSLEIPEGEVKAIHDSNNQLLWGRVNYDTKYKGDALQQAYTGKNLFISQNFTGKLEGVTYTLNGSNLDVTGKKTSGANYYFIGDALTLDNDLPPGTYTFSIKKAQNVGIGINLYYKNIEGAFGLRIPAGSTSATATSSHTMSRMRPVVTYLETGTTYDEHFEEIQLEKSASPTSFEPYVGGIPSPNPDYPQPVQTVTGTQVVSITDGTNTQNFTIDLGSTELAKIGNYQDYIYKSGDDWYVHKEIGKYLITGAETFGFNTTRNSASFSLSGLIMSSSGDIITIMSDKFMAVTQTQMDANSSLDNWIGPRANQIAVIIKSLSNFTNATEAKNWFTSHPTYIYYVLATPTDTQITDATLVGQLNAVHEWLTRYGYNATVSGNLPLIVDRTNL